MYSGRPTVRHRYVSDPQSEPTGWEITAYNLPIASKTQQICPVMYEDVSGPGENLDKVWYNNVLRCTHEAWCNLSPFHLLRLQLIFTVLCYRAVEQNVKRDN